MFRQECGSKCGRMRFYERYIQVPLQTTLTQEYKFYNAMRDIAERVHIVSKNIYAINEPYT